MAGNQQPPEDWYRQQYQKDWHRQQQQYVQQAPMPMPMPMPMPGPQVTTPGIPNQQYTPSPQITKAQPPYTPPQPKKEKIIPKEYPFPRAPHVKLVPKYEIQSGFTFDKSIKHPEKLTTPMLNGRIVQWINKTGKDRSLRAGNDVSFEFWDDFTEEGQWTEEIYNIADKQALRDLRTFLRENGVFVKTTRGISIAKCLAEIDWYKETWSAEEIDEQMRYRAKKQRQSGASSTIKERTPRG